MENSKGLIEVRPWLVDKKGARSPPICILALFTTALSLSIVAMR